MPAIDVVNAPPAHIMRRHNEIERALIARLPKQHDIRCGLSSPLTCRATNSKGVVSFFSAVRYKSDGKWHFQLIGQVV